MKRQDPYKIKGHIHTVGEGRSMMLPAPEGKYRLSVSSQGLIMTGKIAYKSLMSVSQTSTIIKIYITFLKLQPQGNLCSKAFRV